MIRTQKVDLKTVIRTQKSKYENKEAKENWTEKNANCVSGVMRFINVGYIIHCMYNIVQ